MMNLRNWVIAILTVYSMIAMAQIILVEWLLQFENNHVVLEYESFYDSYSVKFQK